MRRLILMTVFLAAANGFAHDHSDDVDHAREPAGPTPIAVTAQGSVYGAALPDPMPVAIDIDAAAANIAAHTGTTAAFSGRITQVCQKKGCWIVLAGENGGLARVFMHDHSFSVPTHSSGAAVVYGTLSEKQLSTAEIEHLKEDGAQTPAQRELQIDAQSVLIRTSG